MRSPNRSFSRDANTGVSAISGTSSNACSPRFTAARINSMYTSVFPLPVTPSRRNGANVPRVAWTAVDRGALLVRVADLRRRRAFESGEERVERVASRAPLDADDASSSPARKAPPR